MVAEKTFDEFVKGLENITFISFNYDRCIEQFIASATASYFNMQRDQLDVVMDALNIIHPYGSVGRIAFNNNLNSNYGHITDGKVLYEQSSQISTFTEQMDSRDILRKIDESLESCKVSVFLGFSFLPLNMDLLCNGKQYSIHKVIGTSKGLSEESSSIAARELEDFLMYGSGPGREQKRLLGTRKAELSNCTCSELIHRHHRFFQRQPR